jgi:hypothetical protein
VSFAAIILRVASQQVFIVVYFFIDSVRKLLDTPSYLCLSFKAYFTFLYLMKLKYELYCIILRTTGHKCPLVENSLLLITKNSWIFQVIKKCVAGLVLQSCKNQTQNYTSEREQSTFSSPRPRTVHPYPLIVKYHVLYVERTYDAFPLSRLTQLRFIHHWRSLVQHTHSWELFETPILTPKKQTCRILDCW